MAQSSFQLSLGNALAQTTRVFLRNLLPFLLLGGLITLPGILFQSGAARGDPREALPRLLLATLINFLSYHVLVGALAHGVVQQLRGEPTTFAEILSQWLRSLPRVLVTSVLSLLLLIAACVLFVIPMIWLAVRFWIAVPVSVMEGKIGAAALQRSGSLVEGSWWMIFLGLVLLVMVCMGIGVVIVVLSVTRVIDLESGQLLWFSVPFNVLTNTYVATSVSVVYYQLRTGKESGTARDMASVFG